MRKDNSESLVMEPMLLPFATQLTAAQDEYKHAHKFFEFFYITAGKITHKCNGITEELSEGDAALICPDAYHSFIRKGTCIHRDLLFSTELMKAACNYIDDKIYDELTLKGFVRFRMREDEVLAYEKQIATFLSYYDVRLRHIQEKLLAASILGHLLFSENDKETPSNDFRTKCITVVNTHFSHANAMQLITDDLCLNQSYLCKRFKSVFNMTLTEYINDLRIKHASYLLQATDYTQQKICESIGIESVSYFNKIFKAKYGVSPGQFRRQSSNNQDGLPFSSKAETASDSVKST